MAALRHGTPSAYNRGCRCDVCRAGRTERARKARAAKTGAPAAESAPKPCPAPRRATDQPTPAEAPPAPPADPARILGPIERAIEEDLANLGEAPGAWFATHKAAARSLARALDGADAQLTARLYPQLLDALGRLGIHAARPADDTRAAGGSDTAALTLVADDELADATAGIRIQGRGPTALRNAT